MGERRLRQQPGFACEECRRRKARCDRVRPRCGFCTETGTQCVVVDKRQQRGPKKGQLNSMRSQIATLRWQLDQQLGRCPEPGQTVSGATVEDAESEPRPDTHAMLDDFTIQSCGWNDTDPTIVSGPSTAQSATAAPSVVSDVDGAGLPDWSEWLNWQDWQDPSGSGIAPPDLAGATLVEDLDAFEASTTLFDTKLATTDLMRADLDQLYFDRVHPVCPIIHRRRYFASLGEERPTTARVCLQSAMRTLAAAMSANWRELSDQLCVETRCLLETYSPSGATFKDEIPVEHIQAWLLLAHCEVLRVGVHQAMLTAGRAFRLVQMARFCDVDAGDGRESGTEGDDSQCGERFVDAEEKRRTFWLAFSFDRLLCLRDEWPLTLHEEMICTRLPAPDANFQASRPARASSLPEAMAHIGPSPLSPFGEYIVLATLHGRCMTHRRSYAKDYGAEKGDFWIRQEWLASAVEKRVQMLTSSPAVDDDPMLLFTHLLAHGATVYLHSTIQQVLCRTVEQQLVAAAYERRASRGAAEIVRLAKAVPAISGFKAHPFLPGPLACAATFLITRSESGSSRTEDVGHLVRVLNDLREIHCLAREHLETLEAHG